MKRSGSFANAIKWAYMGNVGDRAISGLITVLLAGLLGPRDFGIVGIALIYVNFMQMFLDQGLAAALIQKKEVQQEHCDAVFWANLLMSCAFVALTVLISGWWARINHAPDLARVLSVLSICIPIEGLSIVQAAIVRREMDFKMLTIRSNISGLLARRRRAGDGAVRFRRVVAGWAAGHQGLFRADPVMEAGPLAAAV